MTSTWIVFSIDDQQVYQIKYSGCTGQDVIDTYKSMLAGEYKVNEAEVKVWFKDDLSSQNHMSLKTRVTNFEFTKQVKELLSLDVMQN